MALETNVHVRVPDTFWRKLHPCPMTLKFSACANSRTIAQRLAGGAFRNPRVARHHEVATLILGWGLSYVTYAGSKRPAQRPVFRAVGSPIPTHHGR